MKAKHIIFFDDECPFCRKSVLHILQQDIGAQFLFAPLKGETAKEILIGPQAPLIFAQSLILVEDYVSDRRQFYIRSKAVFRIYWILGGWWRMIGVLGFLPSGISDGLYRYFAAHRHQFKLKMPEAMGSKDRFLP